MSTRMSHNVKRLEEFQEEGLASALTRGLQNACENTRNDRTFEQNMFTRRISGVMRWTFVDQSMYDIAPRFGFEPRRVRVGRGFPEMFMIQRGNVIISAHHIRANNRAAAPPYAQYRQALMPPAPVQDRLLVTQAERMAVKEWDLQTDALELWTMTYHLGADRQPEWITIGRPAQRQSNLFFHRDLYALAGQTPPAYVPIVLNNPDDIPHMNITLPNSAKLEGEGEK